jgi:hypothetical protein
METYYRDFTFKDVEILISIHNLLPKNVFLFMGKLFFPLGRKVNDRKLWKIADILIKEGIFEVGKFGELKTYCFRDDKKLIQLIQRQKIVQPLFKFFEDIHSIVV